jgi:hypothetical protein
MRSLLCFTLQYISSFYENKDLTEKSGNMEAEK